MKTPDEVPRAHRIFAVTFLAAFLIAGFSPFEPYPLTSWHLFSGARPQHSEVWRAATADARGVETPIAFDRFGVRYAGWFNILKRFPTYSDGRRLALCDSWAREIRALGTTVREVRVYRGDRDLSARVGLRGAPPTYVLAYVCRDGAVSAR